jgi:hypothetical protein
MQEFCHRCGGELPAESGESPFCPQCGAPQLSLALEQQSVETGGERQQGGVNLTDASTTSAQPTDSQRVDWRTAIRCAALVAAVGAVLSLGAIRGDTIFSICFLWTMSGSWITLALYQRQRPTAWMDFRVGARIGVVVGLFLMVGLGVAGAGVGLVERYGLHSMGGFDAQMTEQIRLSTKTFEQQAMQQKSAPIPPGWLEFMQTNEFRAGMMLIVCAFFSVVLLAFSALGGAFAGLLRTRRKLA